MPKTSGSPQSFESAITELETIVREMESGTISLEQALEHYRKGIGLLKYCDQTLRAAEQQVSKLENGRLKPLSETGPEPDEETA